jgi:hypothetical protein
VPFSAMGITIMIVITITDIREVKAKMEEG